MMSQLKNWILLGFLFLFIVACNSTPPTAPPLPTSADPTELPPPTVILATTLPPPPTGAPTAAVTREPSPPTGDSLLPSNAVWVFVDNAIIAAAPSLPQIILGDDPLTLNPQTIQVAPDGSRIAYTIADAQGRARFYTLDTRDGGQRVYNDIPYVTVASPRFSPDGQELALAVIDQNTPDSWQLQVNGLPDESVRVLDKFVRSAPTDHLAPLSPIAWTPNGLFVERLLWGSDAPPHGIARIDPQSGKTEMLNDEDHIRVEISPDGTRGAQLTGILPMGPDVDSSSTLTTIDLTTGQAQPLFTDQDFWVAHIRWAPDGDRLVYTKQEAIGGAVSEMVLTARDGTGQQVLRFGEGGVPGMLQDVVWRDRNTLLLLVAGEDGLLHLYEARLDPLVPEVLREVGSFGGSQQQGVTPRILYVPGA